MKPKRLLDYLELMRLATEKGKPQEVIRLGERALKNLASLKHSLREKVVVYSHLGRGFHLLGQYSSSLDAYYKASLMASKYRLPPHDVASIFYQQGFNYLWLYKPDLALRHFQKVEEYYQKHGYEKPPMSLFRYLNLLVGIADCYLSQNNPEKARVILEEKISLHRSALTKPLLIDYYFLKSEYLMQTKDYTGARVPLEQIIQLARETESFPDEMMRSKILLAYLDIREGQPGSAITILKSVLKGAGRLKNQASYHKRMCIILFSLSKAYTWIGSDDKAEAAERRLKGILQKIDIAWFYGFNKEIERLYQEVEKQEDSYRFRQGGMGQEPSATTRLREVLNERLSSEWSGGKPDQYVIIAKSSVMMEVYQLIEKVAPTDLPILIYGETGTGKELVARAVHQRSLRSRGTWLACNTGAIPETLLESELFGYVKGAFTGAQSDKKGYIELASDGTLFLDEIGNMSLGMQQKLLRVMEDNQLWRVGAEKPIQVNTRFVFASNENLETLVREKRFREDLLYRINTIIITLPPLRERKEDIPLLVQHFLKKYSGKHTSFAIPDSVARILTDYPWPGNVRELENEIKRLCLLHGKESEIKPEMLSEPIRISIGKTIEPETAPEEQLDLMVKIGRISLAEMEREVIIRTLKFFNGNISKAAKQLGFTWHGLSRKLKRYQIKT